MRTLLLGIVFGLLLSTPHVQAQNATQNLGTCLTDYTTGKDRKALARWIFTSLAAHPEIDSLSNVTPSDRNATARETADLFTRLLTESCADEVKAAVDSGDRSAIENAFAILGEVAMGELMRAPEVSNAMEAIIPYLDMEKLKSVLQER